MKVYIDVLFIINFVLDYILLFTVQLFLKRKTSFRRIFLSTLVGEFSCLSLFFPLSSITLLLIKFLTSIFMLLIAFSYSSFLYFKKNLLTFYLFSVLLGGIIYFLQFSFSIKNTDLWNNILLFFIGPILFLYSIKKMRENRINLSLKHTIEVYLHEKKYIYTAYLDTGNQLVDPYFKKGIILVYDRRLSFLDEESILVPYQTLGYDGILRCQKPDKVILDEKIEIKNILIGEAKKKFNLDDATAILPNIIKEDLK